MMTDIEIAQSAEKWPIQKIADQLGIRSDEIELYGNDKAKLSPHLWDRIKNNPDGILILVTAINPTPAGEGKTTTSIGLAQAMQKLGHKVVLTLREPSLGPCMGMKGGATGGGYAQVLPMDDINLHFTGDMHAITAANNLIAAVLDNHLYHGNALRIDPRTVVWKRAVDMNDRALRHIVVGLGGKANGVPREDSFQITVASEIMAVLCLADDMVDLQTRIGKMVVGYTYDHKPVFVEDLSIVGAVSALLKDAIKPNLVQTLEHTPVLIHGGPFANIAHGCNSVIATRYGLKLGDYCITEAGFGADLGAEKFFNIKCRSANVSPSVVVIVATVRSLKFNGGQPLDQLGNENLTALAKGMANLQAHIENINKFGVPAVVAINTFSTDTVSEIDSIRSMCNNLKIPVAVSRVWAEGGAGGIQLARTVIETMKTSQPHFHVLYDEKLSIEEKIETIAKTMYGAADVAYSAKARAQLKNLQNLKFHTYPMYMAKTQYSLSDNPKLLGKPSGFTLTVQELRIANGAGFIVALCGDIMTMPGLPVHPAAQHIHLDQKGTIKGLF